MRRGRLALCASLTIALAAPSTAHTITCFHDGIGSGSLDGVPFALTGFRITCVGNTDDRQAFESEETTGFFIDNTSASIQIDEVDTVVFLTGTRVFVNNTLGVVGFTRADDNNDDLFDGPADRAFSTWNMLSSIGPFNGDGLLTQWDLDPVIQTSGGILQFDTARTTATFQAITDALPCPSDIDDSGDVGFGDLLAVLVNWGPCIGCPADLDGSGEVDFNDLLEVLVSWGPCP